MSFPFSLDVHATLGLLLVLEGTSEAYDVSLVLLSTRTKTDPVRHSK